MQDYVGGSELALRWGVSRNTIWRWRKRDKDPLPCEMSPGGSTIFNVKTADSWFHRKRPASRHGWARRVREMIGQ